MVVVRVAVHLDAPRGAEAQPGDAEPADQLHHLQQVQRVLLLVPEEAARAAVVAAAERQRAALEVVQLPDPQLVWAARLAEAVVELVGGCLWRGARGRVDEG